MVFAKNKSAELPEKSREMSKDKKKDKETGIYV